MCPTTQHQNKIAFELWEDRKKNSEKKMGFHIQSNANIPILLKSQDQFQPGNSFSSLTGMHYLLVHHECKKTEKET